MSLRTLRLKDHEAALRLIDATLGGSAYAQRAREVVEQALEHDAEWRALGAFATDPAAMLTGLAAFGPVAGTHDSWRFPLLIVSRATSGRDTADALIHAVIAAARGEGARIIMAELPADGWIGFALSALRAHGFRQEARIPDYFRDGVALLFLRRDDRPDDAPAPNSAPV